MDDIRRLSSISNLEEVASDLKRFLTRKDNDDIAREFPGFFARYTDDIENVIAAIDADKKCERRGRTEQFITFMGKRAVGYSIITSVIDTPDGIDPMWPNLSGLICRPFRGIGLGRLSIETRLRAVQKSFGGHAWTLVRSGNIPSERLVESVGFKKAGASQTRDAYNLYTYETENV